jgi:hypothetical protein
MNYKDILINNSEWIFSIEDTSKVFILSVSSDIIYTVEDELGNILRRVLLDEEVSAQELQALKDSFPSGGNLQDSNFEVFTNKEIPIQVYADEVSFKQNLKYRMT